MKERIERTDVLDQEIKDYIPNFDYFANLCCRVIKNYLYVHHKAGWYKENFQIAIITLLKLYTATGNVSKMYPLISKVTNFLPCMDECLPTVKSGSGISAFNYEFSKLGYELKNLKIQ